MVIELIKGAALLLALSLLQSFIRRYWRSNQMLGKVASGFLFGLICIVGMMAPLDVGSGVIFDARSVVLSMSGLFGGPVVGAIATVMAGGYRFWIGGAGGNVGIAVVIACTSLGLIYRYAHIKNWVKVGFVQLLIFGAVVHIVEILLFTQLPAEIVQEIFDNVAIPLFLTFTPAVAFLGLLLQDIENRLATDKALKDSERQKKIILNSIPDLVWLKDINGAYLACNPMFEKFFGAKEAKIIGRTDYDFVDRELADFFREHDKKAIEANKPTINEEWITFSDDGHRALVETIKTPFLSDNGTPIGVLGIARDITERKQSEETITALKELYEDLYQNAPDMFVSADVASQNIIQCNQTFLNKLGYSRDEVIGFPLAMIYHANCFDEAMQTFQKFISTGSISDTELRLKRKDGTGIYVNLNASAVHDEDGNIIASRSVFRDITEQRELEAVLRQSNKMDAVGNLAGGIAHDVNNMLLPIISLTEMTLRDMPEGSKARKRLEKVIEAGVKAKNLIAGILAFSHRDDAQENKEKVGAADLLLDTLGLLRTTLPSTINITEKLDLDTGLIYCDSSQISSVLMNIAANAVDAFEGHVGELAFSVVPIQIAEPQRLKTTQLEPGGYAKISISDTGCGMNNNTLEHIFDPFFTTKDVGKGSGLGLSMAHGIITKHGGAIDVSSTIGAGTTFDVYLPLIEQKK